MVLTSKKDISSLRVYFYFINFFWWNGTVNEELNGTEVHDSSNVVTNIIIDLCIQNPVDQVLNGLSLNDI